MENIFRISIRLTSDLYDFEELIPEINEYKIVYHKKGDNLSPKNKNSSFKARSNVLIVRDLCVINNISDEDNIVIIDKLVPLIEILSIMKVEDIKREVYISGRIENQQFGFDITQDLIVLLSEHGYSFSFSGISYV